MKSGVDKKGTANFTTKNLLNVELFGTLEVYIKMSSR